jgi:hypothetical protein
MSAGWKNLLRYNQIRGVHSCAPHRDKVGKPDMNLRKKVTTVFGAAAAASVIAGAAAFACTNLATLNLSSTAGKSGDSVTVTGSSFRVGTGTTATDPVVLRWNGVEGTELARVTPDRAGNISATFAVPDGQPGYYVIVATQKNAAGVDAYGTPARASFQILGANGQSVVTPAVSSAGSTVASSPSSSGIIALTVGLGALGLALFGAGFVAFVRQARRRDVPVTASVRK